MSKPKLLLGVGLSLVVTAELVCRLAGLNSPVLSQADPQMEYLFKPNQTTRILGHRIHINAWSMRSDDFPAHKTDPAEFRVMVIGDSVVYDGTQVDQHNISTEVMKRALERDLKRKVTVGNISARSWGPPNELAYVKRFGLFDADAVVLVLSSHDYADVPTFEPVIDVDPYYPGHKPLLALTEVFTRYLPRYLPWRRESQTDAGAQIPRQKAIDWALSSERELIELVKASGRKIVLAQMSERGELDGHPKPGHEMIRKIAEEERTPVLDIGKQFEAAVHRGLNPYLDYIHPNKLGCEIMGQNMALAVESR